MENPFKKLLHNEEVPKALREKVINDISLIDFLKEQELISAGKLEAIFSHSAN